MSQAFHDAMTRASNDVRIQMRESRPERLERFKSEDRAQLYRDAFVAGHAKGFEAGWLAAGGRVVDASPEVLDALADQVCAPFSPARAQRAS